MINDLYVYKNVLQFVRIENKKIKLFNIVKEKNRYEVYFD